MLDLNRQLSSYARFIDVAPVTAGEAMRPRGKRSVLRPVLVAAAAALIVLIVIGGFTLLLNSVNRPVIAPVTTTVPAPTTSLAPTTTAPTTTTTAVPLPLITWTRVESPTFGDGYIESMSIANNVVYLTGPAEGFDHGIIWRSEDGTTWERFDLPKTPDLPTIADLGNPNVFGVAYHDGTTVAAGLDCNDTESACLAAVWVSDDNGHTWERIPHQEAFGSTGLHRMLAITATDSGFVAAGDDVWTSPDGRTWTMVEELPGNRNTIWDITATPDLIVGVGQRWEDGSESAIWTSPDGIDWTRVSDEDGDFEAGQDKVSFLSGVTATDGGFVAVGVAGTPLGGDGAVWLSTNGLRWRRAVSPSFKTGHSDQIEGVVASQGLLIAVGEEGNLESSHSNGVVWISSDGGNTWTRLDDPTSVFGNYYAGSSGIEHIKIINDVLIAAGGTPDGVAVWIGTLDSS